jgi:hypothetical protein
MPPIRKPAAVLNVMRLSEGFVLEMAPLILELDL